jgi:hypothetical protein
MIGLAERFSRDLEDFAMLFNGGAQQLPRTTSSFENDSDTLELGMTLGG